MSIKSILSVRLLVVIGVTALIIAVPMLMMQQPAMAAPPPPLRGPFKFIELPQESTRSTGASTISYSPFYTETFDGPIEQKSGWQLRVNTTITNTPDQHKWEYVAQSDYPGQPFTHTLWSASLLTGRPVNYTVHSNSTYLPWMDTWAVYGPLDGRTYRQFQATFSFYLDTDPGAKFGWAASSDGTNFCGQSLSGHVRQWITTTFDLPSCPGDTRRPVYLAFFFQSNGDTPDSLGAFVDNLTLSGAPWLNTYMVNVRLDPTITPTPTPIASPTPILPPANLVKSWDFEPSSDSSNDWCTGSTDAWKADKISIGGSTFYFLKIKQTYSLAMQSPRYQTPNNYRISAQFNFVRFNSGYSLSDFGSAQFGLVFGVNGDTFGTDPNPPDRCPWDETVGGYYKFMLKIKEGGGGYVTRLERFADNNWILLNESELPVGLGISRTDWNTMTIDRNGSGIVAYINGFQVLNLTDTAYMGGRWFGVFSQAGGHDRDSAFESDWDNVQVYNLTP
jgi:hypothetical protein